MAISRPSDDLTIITPSVHLSPDHYTIGPSGHNLVRPLDHQTIGPPYHQMISHCPISCRTSHRLPTCDRSEISVSKSVIDPSLQVHFLWHEKLLDYWDSLRDSINITPSSFWLTKPLSSFRDVYITCLCMSLLSILSTCTLCSAMCVSNWPNKLIV
jgi:hypothetical protein